MGSEPGDAGSGAGDAADSAALSRLLRQADESIVVPEDLWERITEPAAAVSGSSPGLWPWIRQWFRRLIGRDVVR
jgi:hypothetical protein